MKWASCIKIVIIIISFNFRCLKFSHGWHESCWQPRSFYMCGVAIKKKWYRYIFWFLFNVFFCNAFVLESECVGLKGKTLDFKLDRTHQHQQSMVSRNERKSVDGTKFQTEPCYTPKSICFSLYGGQKKEMHTVHKQGEEHSRATKWKQIWHICYIFKNFPWFLVKR